MISFKIQGASYVLDNVILHVMLEDLLWLPEHVARDAVSWNDSNSIVQTFY